MVQDIQHMEWSVCITSMHRWQSTLNLALYAQARGFSKCVGKHCRKRDHWTLLSHPYVTAAVLPRLYIKHPFRSIARCESAHQDSFMAYAWWCLTIYAFDTQHLMCYVSNSDWIFISIIHFCWSHRRSLFLGILGFWDVILQFLVSRSWYFEEMYPEDRNPLLYHCANLKTCKSVSGLFFPTYCNKLLFCMWLMVEIV